MKEYELIKELFDNCSGRAKSYVEEIETGDLDAYMKQFLAKESRCQKTVLDNGSVEYEVITSGIKSKHTFTEF